MSRYHRDRAAVLTRPQRLALTALEYAHAMTAEHVTIQARYNCFANGVKEPRMAMWRTLKALERRGLVQGWWLYSADAQPGCRLWQLTNTGRLVARYVYPDGEVFL